MPEKAPSVALVAQAAAVVVIKFLKFTFVGLLLLQMACMVDNKVGALGSMACDPSSSAISNFNASVDAPVLQTVIQGGQSCAACHSTSVPNLAFKVSPATDEDKKYNLCLIYKKGHDAYQRPTSGSHTPTFTLSEIQAIKTWIDNPQL